MTSLGVFASFSSRFCSLSTNLTFTFDCTSLIGTVVSSDFSSASFELSSSNISSNHDFFDSAFSSFSFATSADLVKETSVSKSISIFVN